MRDQHITLAAVAFALVIALALAIALSLACTATGFVTRIGRRQVQFTPTATATRTRIPRDSIDFNATALAAAIQAGGGYIVTSTPVPVWPTDTPVPFNQASFLATINAQFAQATETARALATPTFIPSPTPTSTPPPPRFLPPAGGSAPRP
jgi:hypothetical protein